MFKPHLSPKMKCWQLEAWRELGITIDEYNYKLAVFPKSFYGRVSTFDSEKKIYVQYGVIATLILFIGLLYSLVCLKPGNTYYPRSSRPNKSFKELLGEAKASLKTP